MRREIRRVIIQAALFIVTFITTTLAGAEWTYGKSIYFTPNYSWQDFSSGFEFSVPLLVILTVHEFGHYFTAMYHKVKATLPYYLPIPPLPLSIGTMGAVILFQSRVPSKKKNFDIGIAGPLAGFVMALALLFYGFTHLPEPEYIFEIHPEYEKYGLNYADSVYLDQQYTMANADSVNEDKNGKAVSISIGKNLVFLFFENFVADPAKVPNPNEIMHYPLLFSGYLALLLTWLNLLPIGQLDGGHVVYGLFGSKIHRIIASVVFIILLLYAGLGIYASFDVFNPENSPTDMMYWIVGSALFLYMALSGLGLSKRDTLMYSLIILALLFSLSRAYPELQGYPGWLFFVFILGKFVGIQHPPAEIEEPLDNKRIILGWISLLIFVICFSPAPFVVK